MTFSLPFLQDRDGDRDGGGMSRHRGKKKKAGVYDDLLTPCLVGSSCGTPEVLVGRTVHSTLKARSQTPRDLGNSSVQFTLLSGELPMAMERSSFIGDLSAGPEESSSLPASWELIVLGA